MSAKQYEILIKMAESVNGVSKFPESEVNLYRDLELLVEQSGELNSNKYELKHKIDMHCLRITSNVEDAINKVMDEFRADPNNRKQIGILENLLYQINFQTDKQEIDKIIKESLRVFIELGLKS